MIYQKTCSFQLSSICSRQNPHTQFFFLFISSISLFIYYTLLNEHHCSAQYIAQALVGESTKIVLWKSSVSNTTHKTNIIFSSEHHDDDQYGDCMVVVVDIQYMHIMISTLSYHSLTGPLQWLSKHQAPTLIWPAAQYQPSQKNCWENNMAVAIGNVYVFPCFMQHYELLNTCMSLLSFIIKLCGPRIT